MLNYLQEKFVFLLVSRLVLKKIDIKNLFEELRTPNRRTDFSSVSYININKYPFKHTKAVTSHMTNFRKLQKEGEKKRIKKITEKKKKLTQSV